MTEQPEAVRNTPPAEVQRQVSLERFAGAVMPDEVRDQLVAILAATIDRGWPATGRSDGSRAARAPSPSRY